MATSKRIFVESGVSELTIADIREALNQIEDETTETTWKELAERAEVVRVARIRAT